MRNDFLVILLENIRDLAFLLIFISAFFYRRKLKLIKKEQKLSKIDSILYVLISISLPLYMFVYLLLLLGV